MRFIRFALTVVGLLLPFFAFAKGESWTSPRLRHLSAQSKALAVCEHALHPRFAEAAASEQRSAVYVPSLSADDVARIEIEFDGDELFPLEPGAPFIVPRRGAVSLVELELRQGWGRRFVQLKVELDSTWLITAGKMPPEFLTRLWGALPDLESYLKESVIDLLDNASSRTPEWRGDGIVSLVEFGYGGRRPAKTLPPPFAREQIAAVTLHIDSDLAIRYVLR